MKESYVTPENFDKIVNDNDMYVVSFGLFEDQKNQLESIINWTKFYNRRDPGFKYTCICVDSEIIKSKMRKPGNLDIFDLYAYYKRRLFNTKFIIWKFAYVNFNSFAYVQTWLDMEFQFKRSKMLDGEACKCPLKV